MNLKINFEKIIVTIFIILFLFLGLGTTYDHKIDQENPQAFFAMDYGWKTSRADNLLEQGNQIYRAPHMAEGIDYTTETYPPLWGHQLAFLSKVSGLDLFDCVFLLVNLYVLLTILVCYSIVRKFNKIVALSGLPVALFMMTFPFVVPTLFGYHSMILGFFFMFTGLFLTINYFDWKFYPYVISIISAAAFFAHPPEFFFLLGYIIIFASYKILESKFTLNIIKSIGKKAFLIFLLFILITSYFLPVIFPNNIDPSNPEESSEGILERLFGSGARFKGWFNWEPNTASRIPLITDFSYFLIPILGGLLISLFLKKKDRKYSILFVYLFLINFVPYLGFKRFEQYRFIWPIYLIFFFGLSIFYLINAIKKGLKNDTKIKKQTLLIPIIIIIGAIFFATLYQPIVGTSINEDQWDTINWIKDNTNTDSSVYYMGAYDTNKKSALSFTRRKVYRIFNDFDEIAAKENLTRYYNSTWITNKRPLFQRISFFDFEKVNIDDYFSYYSKMMDLCEMDYIIVDSANLNQNTFSYVNKITNQLVENGALVTYSTQSTLVLENQKIVGDCIE